MSTWPRPLASQPEEGNLEMFTITGTVGTDGKYLVTGMPVDTATHTVLKLAFENNTAGTNRYQIRRETHLCDELQRRWDREPVCQRGRGRWRPNLRRGIWKCSP